ncbi:hypothetical protein B0H10DRAFT_1962561 [Mycena sp. CBHHK59/15]|nr:hypothetical protein B0H10DRAFT_1962561 [Mycena sp. CBHHK59/15]
MFTELDQLVLLLQQVPLERQSHPEQQHLVRPDSSSPREGGPTSSLEREGESLEQPRQRNEMLQERICTLEGQMQSQWALGFSEEPPPGYLAGTHWSMESVLPSHEQGDYVFNLDNNILCL